LPMSVKRNIDPLTMAWLIALCAETAVIIYRYVWGG
jgi:hypothetical protein